MYIWSAVMSPGGVRAYIVNTLLLGGTRVQALEFEAVDFFPCLDCRCEVNFCARLYEFTVDKSLFVEGDFNARQLIATPECAAFVCFNAGGHGNL